jgi:BASS family bile acid:Na+ symporter
MALSSLEQGLLITMIFFLMVGIGSSLDLKSFLFVRKMKKPVITALLLQYISMPLIALFICLSFNFDTETTMILLLITCCPGGTTSNMFSYFSKANVELSILLTTTTTVLAFIMTPLLLNLYGKSLNSDLIIPTKQMFLILLSMITPIVIGFIIKQKNSALALRVERYGSLLGLVAISIMVVIWVPKLLVILKQQNQLIFIGLGLISFTGIITALVISIILKNNKADAKTISFETGIQNAPLAFAIISLSFSPTIVERYNWIPLVYGALSVGIATFYLIIYRIFPFQDQVVDV